MSPAEVLRRIIAALDQAGIPHMLTGSYAGAFHGAPRATQDLDLVISPTEAQLREFARQLPADRFYVPLEAAQEALRQETMFNVIDLVGGWKIDLILRKSRPFSRTEFERRQPANVFVIALSVATLEDLILAKLEWARHGGSRRQVEDVAELLRRRAPDLDLPYLQPWIGVLGLEREWAEATRLGSADRRDS